MPGVHDSRDPKINLKLILGFVYRGCRVSRLSCFAAATKKQSAAIYPRLHGPLKQVLVKQLMVTGQYKENLQC